MLAAISALHWLHGVAEARRTNGIRGATEVPSRVVPGATGMLFCCTGACLGVYELFAFTVALVEA